MNKCLSCTGFVEGTDLYPDAERCFECVADEFPDRYEKDEEQKKEHGLMED